MVLSVDYVNSLGGNLNFRPRVNQRIPGQSLEPAPARGDHPDDQPEHQRHSADGQPRRERIQRAHHEHTPPPVEGHRLHRLVHAAEGLSTIGTAADELNTANIQDPNNPFDDPRQLGPNLTTDSRHLINLSATFQIKGGFRIAPIFFFRSALPVNLIDGRDLNLDGDALDIPVKAYAVDSFDASGTTNNQTTFREIGNCETVNCGRGLAQTRPTCACRSRSVSARTRASRRSGRSSTVQRPSTRAASVPE